MEKDRSSKVMAIAALVIAVIGLGIGFAAFTSTLTISSSASVTPSSSSFNVVFSTSATEVQTAAITPSTTGTGVTGTEAVINNSGNEGSPLISNLSAAFTEPGQSVKYEFFAYNAGEYIAYLKSISYANVTGENSPKVCAAVTGGDVVANDALVQNACNGISLKVQVEGLDETDGSVNGITTHQLAKATGEKITVTIEYASTASRADGKFTVKFGDISLLYSSVDA